jgi:pimeloyl-ACP methyl ester carboxylesterase
MRLRAQRGEGLDWLLCPGGPGLGSESLEGLADCLSVTGAIWLIDLPGDGPNRAPPGAGPDPFAAWPDVVAEAGEAVALPAFVGHSTGGMYLLASPAVGSLAKALVLIGSAPSTAWQDGFASLMASEPLPAVDAAMLAYEEEPSDERLAAVTLAAAPWSFAPAALSRGRAMLAGLPFNWRAVDWSSRNFDATYRLAWWRDDLPTLILAGAEDRIVDQSVWDDPRFAGGAVERVAIPAAGHFPWIEKPHAVGSAFADFATRCDPMRP